ncbi:MAG: SUMF1/EgtB/PvdO family nonheme iron enzyme, partial [Planctomycetales bacterium]|nr:SUMF1/EgtB/PvdO family nonheme iron enzyme [Planctomycetales bacterium]
MNERVIFDAALEIADSQARRAFIEKACAGDPEMRAAVESLLKSHDSAGSFLDIPAAEQMQNVAPSHPEDSAAADEPTRRYQPGAIDEDSDDADDSKPDLSFLQPSSKPGSIGVLGHYEVLSVLGQGAFGIVFKAFDEKLHRLVAIKVMNPQLAATSPPRKRFLREARAAAAIRHENVVQVYSVEEQPLPYLVMEFIDGQTLKDKLDGAGPLETPEVLHIARQIASGLAAAQTMGLIHRDIKPANILLEQGAEQRVKISDFGLARAADDASMTRTGVISGTPMYMAPEQAQGQSLDHRADLFSLGSVLYQMACGRPPFRAATTIAVLRRVVEDTPRPLQEILPEIPDWLVAIVTKLHAKKPEDRFQSAKEVADLLARCQSELQHNGQVTCVAVAVRVVESLRDSKLTSRSDASERSRHAPRDEPNAPPTLNSQPTSSNATPAATQSSTRSTPNETSTSTPRSAHHAERDGYVGGKRSNVSRYFIAATLIGIAVIAGLIIKPWQNDNVAKLDPVTPPIENQKSKIENAQGWHGWPAEAPPPAIAPFNAEQAQQHQEAWAKYLGVPVEYTNSLGMKFRLIPPGEFMMGSSPAEIETALNFANEGKKWEDCIKSEAPQHKVINTRPIYLGVNEVTQGQYERIMGKNPSHFTSLGPGKGTVAGMDSSRLPVEMVSWNDAVEFCEKLSQQEKLKPFALRIDEAVTPLNGNAYRLSAETEWEFACRAGTTTKYSIGDKDNELAPAGWSNLNSDGRSHVVGELKSNSFGIHDMHGNVWEWVQDGWDQTYYQQFQEKAAIDASGPTSTGFLQVIRSGGWSRVASHCRSSSRHAVDPFGRAYDIGFRVALPIEYVKATSKERKAADAAWHGWSVDAPPPAIAPFNAEQAQQHQEAWAKYLGVPVEYTNSLGMKFRLIPPGEFSMGSTVEEIAAALKDVGTNEYWQECVQSEAPQHKVILTQPIYLGMNEVTQAEYEKVMGVNPSRSAPLGTRKDPVAGLETAEHPVEMVSWYDAAEFCTKLSKQEELKPFYFRAGETVTPLDGTGYRLPSEAEWEFACRAGTATKYWIGDQDADLVRAGWFGGNSGSRTHAAGELKANPFGLSDIHGNVWEWVQDGWDATYYGQFPDKPAINPNSPFSAGSRRVVRGGDWRYTASNCRSSDRHAAVPAGAGDHVGFRVSLVAVGSRVGESSKVTGPAMPNRPKATVTDGSTSSTAKPLTPLPPLDLDETDPLPGWELPPGAPPPVVAPCEPTLAKERQQLWAEFLKRPVIEENAALGMKFALIPPGEFRKIFTRPRDPAIEPDMPVRRFRITKPYALSTTEVTWDQFRQFVEATGYQTEAETNGLGGRDRDFKPDPNGKITWRTPGWKPAPNEPVTQVTPRDAEAFCAWLTLECGGSTPLSDRGAATFFPNKPTPPTSDTDAKKEKESGSAANQSSVKPEHSKFYYRLPTEAEWVHACRSGSVHKHVVGPEPGDLADYAWTQEFLDPNPQASPLHLVAQKKPNPFGLHDTLGNVLEYTRDVLSPAARPYLPTNDPLAMTLSSLMGSAWSHEQLWGNADFNYPHDRAQSDVGFRVLKQFDGEPLPGPLDRPLVLRAGQPLSVHALVPRPEKIPGLQSWSIELAGPHAGGATPIAASSNGDLIATGSAYGKISLWDRDGKYQRALIGHEGTLISLNFSPNGRWLASCERIDGYRGDAYTARLWNVETGALHAVLSGGGCVAFSP